MIASPTSNDLKLLDLEAAIQRKEETIAVIHRECEEIGQLKHRSQNQLFTLRADAKQTDAVVESVTFAQHTASEFGRHLSKEKLSELPKLSRPPAVVQQACRLIYFVVECRKLAGEGFDDTEAFDLAWATVARFLSRSQTASRIQNFNPKHLATCPVVIRYILNQVLKLEYEPTECPHQLPTSAILSEALAEAQILPSPHFYHPFDPRNPRRCASLPDVSSPMKQPPPTTQAFPNPSPSVTVATSVNHNISPLNPLTKVRRQSDPAVLIPRSTSLDSMAHMSSHLLAPNSNFATPPQHPVNASPALVRRLSALHNTPVHKCQTPPRPINPALHHHPNNVSPLRQPSPLRGGPGLYPLATHVQFTGSTVTPTKLDQPRRPPFRHSQSERTLVSCHNRIGTPYHLPPVAEPVSGGVGAVERVRQRRFSGSQFLGLPCHPALSIPEPTSILDEFHHSKSCRRPNAQKYTAPRENSVSKAPAEPAQKEPNPLEGMEPLAFSWLHGISEEDDEFKPQQHSNRSNKSDKSPMQFHNHHHSQHHQDLTPPKAISRRSSTCSLSTENLSEGGGGGTGSIVAVPSLPDCDQLGVAEEGSSDDTNKPAEAASTPEKSPGPSVALDPHFLLQNEPPLTNDATTGDINEMDAVVLVVPTGKSVSTDEDTLKQQLEGSHSSTSSHDNTSVTTSEPALTLESVTKANAIVGEVFRWALAQVQCAVTMLEHWDEWRRARTLKKRIAGCEAELDTLTQRHAALNREYVELCFVRDRLVSQWRERSIALQKHSKALSRVARREQEERACVQIEEHQHWRHLTHNMLLASSQSLGFADDEDDDGYEEDYAPEASSNENSCEDVVCAPEAGRV